MVSGDSFPKSIALVGFGEAGQALAGGFLSDTPALAISAYDVKTDAPENSVAATKWDEYRTVGVTGSSSIGEALSGKPVIFSLVTADHAHEAACAAAKVLHEGALFFDCNSCAPDTKRASARAIEAAGGRYVDAAVMSPVHPKRHKVPMLVSGPHAEDALPVMDALGMSARIIEGDVGRASSIKMLRSVMIKGMEALTLESLLAARKAGVEEEVVASLDASMPGWDWAVKAAYNMERTATHGIRRAAEMREVAQTVTDLGLPPRMAQATVDWQQDMGDLGLKDTPEDLGARADAILSALEDANRRTIP